MCSNASSSENSSYLSSDFSDTDMKAISNIDNIIAQIDDQHCSTESNSDGNKDETCSWNIDIKNPSELSEIPQVQIPYNLSPGALESKHFYSTTSESPHINLKVLENEKVSAIYNKIIQLCDEKYSLESNHNFLQCNICGNLYWQVILQNVNFHTLYKYVNDDGIDKICGKNLADAFFTKLFNCTITEGSQISFSNNEKSTYEISFDINRFLETSINEKNLDFKTNFHSSNPFEWDTVLEIAKLKVQKCYRKVTDISDLQSNFFNKSFEEENISCNNRKVLKDFLKTKTEMLEDFIITENLPFVKIFLEKIINQMNEDNLSDLPDFYPFQLLMERVNLTKNINFSQESYVQGELKNDSLLISVQSKENLRDEDENMREKFSSPHAEQGNHVESVTSDYDSDTSSFSGESEIESVVDCENKLTRIPPKTSFFLSYINIKSSDIKKIYELAYRMKFGVIGKSVENITTHVIVPDTWKEKNFTHSYLAAIAKRSYIVTFQWVVDCLQADRILPLFSYIPNQPGALSCLENNRRKLFEGFCIYFPNTEDQESKKRNEHLAEICGAVISNNLRYAKGTRVLVSDTTGTPELIWQCLDVKVFPVHSSWLHDSIFLYAVQPLQSYSLVNASDEILAYFSDEVPKLKDR